MKFGRSVRVMIGAMLKEEYRFHTSFTRKYVFFTFPIFVFIVTFIMGITSDRIVSQVPLETLLTMIHGGVFLYGLGVGALAFLANQLVTWLA